MNLVSSALGLVSYAPSLGSVAIEGVGAARDRDGETPARVFVSVERIVSRMNRDRNALPRVLSGMNPDKQALRLLGPALNGGLQALGRVSSARDRGRQRLDHVLLAVDLDPVSLDCALAALELGSEALEGVWSPLDSDWQPPRRRLPVPLPVPETPANTDVGRR